MKIIFEILSMSNYMNWLHCCIPNVISVVQASSMSVLYKLFKFTRNVCYTIYNKKAMPADQSGWWMIACIIYLLLFLILCAILLLKLKLWTFVNRIVLKTRKWIIHSLRTKGPSNKDPFWGRIQIDHANTERLINFPTFDMPCFWLC